jgi:Ran GTPase-activating protein (RanGAP) involved in mRNA processing and transport
MDDDGLITLASALEQSTSLQILDLQDYNFGERGFMALAESLPNIKVLQEIIIVKSLESSLPLLLEGLRKRELGRGGKSRL